MHLLLWASSASASVPVSSLWLLLLPLLEQTPLVVLTSLSERLSQSSVELEDIQFGGRCHSPAVAASAQHDGD
jgi:hypothetical protein